MSAGKMLHTGNFVEHTDFKKLKEHCLRLFLFNRAGVGRASE